MPRYAVDLGDLRRSALGHYGSNDGVALWLIVVQILHCGTFTVCHLAAMRYMLLARVAKSSVYRRFYSAVAMGGSIAIMTVFAGFLYQYLGHGVFWVMALVALPAMFCARKLFPHADSRHFADLLLLMCCQRRVRIDQRW